MSTSLRPHLWVPESTTPPSAVCTVPNFDTARKKKIPHPPQGIIFKMKNFKVNFIFWYVFSTKYIEDRSEQILSWVDLSNPTTSYPTLYESRTKNNKFFSGKRKIFQLKLLKIWREYTPFLRMIFFSKNWIEWKYVQAVSFQFLQDPATYKIELLVEKIFFKSFKHKSFEIFLTLLILKTRF